MANKLFGFAAFLITVGVVSSSARAELIYLTNGTSLSTIDSATPGTVINTVAISGMQGGESLVGIDVRPNSPGSIFAIGNTSRMYIINPLTGVVTQIGAAGSFTLNGTFHGTDFNPVVDLVRQVSNTEQNLRLNPTTGLLQGTDTALNPAGNIVAAAYSNNFPGAATTTLHAIDSAAGTLVTINPPAAGTIVTTGSLGLGTNLNEAIGFDISGSSGIGYASITTGSVSRLYTVNLTTGAATLQGTIGSGTTPFLGLAAANAPEPTSLAVFGIAGGLLALRRRRHA